MTTFIALLRAVNVGGTGKLPMSELKTMCEAIGFSNVRTYIASGNVVFDSALAENQVAKKLAASLEEYAGKPVGVMVRTGPEMTAVLKANPFKDAAPNLTFAIFLDTAPPVDAIDNVRGRQDEELALGTREIYVTYPGGSGASKLKIPAAATGTARNMNTIAKLAEMAGA
ncbi:DUF1697 domain-containing protein [Massilia sp. GCM10020059]|uniref:DUF1697 domain-containing protein n=1 Tax=Massilia agrisoli TaxID=2892444 RepID=A0ABS8IPA5_9BURK|nr:DUF1697 domain-containing protein [Massilia agrisoli]MCC6070430.1 DUF1697 domain-containing protein [Massilia agrisoli]